jgi:uncharacterized SAM-binding protein YcdF (DUF218 family)
MTVELAISALARAMILPPASLFLLAATGWLLRRRWPRFGSFLAGAALLTLVILSTNAGSRLLTGPLESMATPLATEAAGGAQAIVVLAAGRLEDAPEYEGKNIPDYIALARLRYAARLQRRTGLPLLVSGGNRAPDGDRGSKAEEMARALREDFGVAVRWVESDSENTAQNAACSARMLQADGITKILLVTDAMHMARAQAVFERSGLQAVAAPTVFFSRTSLGPAGFWPTAEALRRSHYAAYEWVGLAWYRLRNAAGTPSCHPEVPRP